MGGVAFHYRARSDKWENTYRIASLAKCRVADGKGFVVSAELRVARAGERCTVEHRYGVFDEHMSEGEMLAFTLSTNLAEPVQATQLATAEATEVNERRALPLALGGGGAVHLGGVTLLNDYLLIARSASGEWTKPKPFSSRR